MGRATYNLSSARACFHRGRAIPLVLVVVAAPGRGAAGVSGQQRFPLPERVPDPQLREEHEVPVPGKEHLNPVRDADRGDPRVVHHAPVHARALDKRSQRGGGNRPFRRSGGSMAIAVHASKLPPRLVRSARPVLPDPAVGDHAQELEAAGPRNGPWVAPLRQPSHDLASGRVHPGFAAVRVDQHIGVYGDQRLRRRSSFVTDAPGRRR